MFQYIATQLRSTHVVSTSWGLCEQYMPAAVMTTDNNIFMQAAAQGQSWFAAFGDNGADDCGNGGSTAEVDFPASSPYVTGVGGTVLNPLFDANGNATGYGSEAAWSGSGGGTSVTFAKPSYQQGVRKAARRAVPDVALEAGPNPGNLLVFNGRLYRAWGTSIAAYSPTTSPGRAPRSPNPPCCQRATTAAVWPKPLLEPIQDAPGSWNSP